jgi:hypothetical protein
MADVSVEFGAKDVGLQDSLKKIQSEMQTLEGKVKSGELSFEELESTMKRLGQVERLEKQLQAIGNESAGAAPKVGELGKDIQDAGNKSEKMGEQSGMGFGKFVAGVGLGQVAAKAFTAVLDSAFAAVRGTIQGFTDALDLGGRLSDLSASTGETAGKLLVLERAFDNSGIGAEKVGSSIAKMQKNIEDARDGSGTAANAFAMMGVSVDELEGKLPTEQFKILSSGIQSIDDPTQRAAAAMGVFGKSGAELLPLLTNLEGELGEARDTVGSMAEIMDRRNATFDAVGDRFKTIGEKVRDFAAGILDKALPAIDAITSALSRIDAAKIGQNLADAFLGGEKAMSGFQSAVDAISVGELGLAFKAFFESAKLQVMQTGNSIINIFSAAFDTVAEIIANVFRSDGPTLMVIKSAFDFVAGYVKEKVAGSLADTFAGMGPMFSGMAESLKQSAEAGATSAELALQRIPIAAELAAEDIGTNLAGSVDRFKENLSEANTEFFNTGEQAKKVADIEAEIATRVAATNDQRAATTAQTEAELAKRQELRAVAEAAAATEQANAVALVELETAINAAKAGGNEELLKSLESEKKRLEGQQEIAKLTEEYKTKLGVNADEAARLATNFVNAKDAAAGVAVDKTTVAEAKKEAAEAATAAKSFATWLDYIQGVDPSAPVKSLKEQTADARREITAFGEYIGTDLKNKSFPDIARELGIKNLGDTGTEQMNQILAHIASKRGELTGIQPIDEQGGKNSLQNIQAEITKLGTTQQPLNLDASASIESIKSKLKENIDLAITTGEGSKILGEIKTFVSEIKTLVGKIEPKLPVAALTA